MSVEKMKVIKKEDLPKKIGKEVEINNARIALFHLSNGEVYAIEDRCPHTNGPLAEGIVSGDYVYCPLQNWKVSLVTGEVQAPNEGVAQVYKTEIIDGYVYVEV